MLTPEQVKPYFIHPDQGVRAHAGHYFENVGTSDPTLVPLILDACARFGFEDNWYNLSIARELTLSDSSLRRTLRLLGTLEHEEDRLPLAGIVASAPGELLLPLVTTIEQIPAIGDQEKQRVRRRAEYVGWTGDRLWSELQDLAGRLDEADDPHEMNRSGLSDDLVDALAAHDVPDSETILRLIKELEPRQEWLEVSLIDLAGRRRLREAVPLLIERLGGDDFLTPGRAADALVRIGDPDVARLLLEKSRSSNEYFRLEAARVLGGIKHEISEAALLELLERETVDWARTWICSALCDLVSERAVDAVRKELASGSDEQYRELASPALAVVTMLGLPRPPEAELWESVQRNQQERMRQFRAESRLEDSEVLSDLVGEEPDDGTAESLTTPIRNTSYRVGRNDPCPCGSGKKFKKCCGRSA
jgi:hypothetical protein